MTSAGTCPLCGRLTSVIPPHHRGCVSRCGWRLCTADAHAPTAILFDPAAASWLRVLRPDRDPDGPPPPPSRRSA